MHRTDEKIVSKFSFLFYIYWSMLFPGEQFDHENRERKSFFSSFSRVAQVKLDSFLLLLLGFTSQFEGASIMRFCFHKKTQNAVDKLTVMYFSFGDFWRVSHTHTSKTFFVINFFSNDLNSHYQRAMKQLCEVIRWMPNEWRFDNESHV